MAVIEVVKPGWSTTVQDRGRWGWQARGVSVSGPMDAYSQELANRLVENPAAAATLEVTLHGPELRFTEAAVCAVAGAEFPLTVDGRKVPMHERLMVAGGSTLRFGLRIRGARAYLAVAGGILTPPVLDSRSTHVVSGVGGLGGRALVAGDRLPVGHGRAAGTAVAGAGALALPSGGARLRLMHGPHQGRFAAAALDALFSSPYRVTEQADRMGFRLEGAPLPEEPGHAELISGVIAAGALQVPALGPPILLMADRATTGGYPIIGVVITADLPMAGQLAPGDEMAFVPCSREEALVAWRDRRRALELVCATP